MDIVDSFRILLEYTTFDFEGDEVIGSREYSFTQENGRWRVDCTKYGMKGEPLLPSRIIDLDQRMVQSFLEQIALVHIPMWPSFPYGCDGQFWVLELKGWSGDHLLRWWCCAPDEWRRIDRLVRLLHLRVLRLLDADRKAES